MNTKPILFSGEMIRALLDGRKTQTRRVIKPQPPADCRSVYLPFQIDPNNWQGICTDDLIGWYGRCPYGKPGDLLWVRETFVRHAGGGCYYRADKLPVKDELFTWNPSSRMPRWASRLTLKLTDVRVERLEQISEFDAACEGYSPRPGAVTARAAFLQGDWAKQYPGNPWVWALTFEVIHENVDAVIQRLAK